MASVTNKDIPEEFAMFGEIFVFRKKYYIPEDSDEYWENVKKDSDVIYVKYKTDLCKDYLIVTMEDFERRLKQVKKGI